MPAIPSLAITGHRQRQGRGHEVKSVTQSQLLALDVNSGLQETDKHPISKDYKTNLSKPLFLLLLTRSKISVLLTLDALSRPPRGHCWRHPVPSRTSPHAGAPSSCPPSLWGELSSLGGRGGTSCFPCLHGREMWHAGRAPVLPGPMAMS